jgi:hypothetical protein
MEDSSDYSSDSSTCYSDRSSPLAQLAVRKSKILEDIIEKLKPIINISYTPFKCEPR